MPKEKRKRQERPPEDGGAAASHRRVQAALAQAQISLHADPVGRTQPVFSDASGELPTAAGRPLVLRTALETLRTYVAHTEQAIDDVLALLDEAIPNQPLDADQPQPMSALDEAEQPDAHSIH